MISQGIEERGASPVHVTADLTSESTMNCVRYPLIASDAIRCRGIPLSHTYLPFPKACGLDWNGDLI